MCGKNIFTELWRSVFLTRDMNFCSNFGNFKDAGCAVPLAIFVAVNRIMLFKIIATAREEPKDLKYI